jgi:hypothetical protein
MCENPQISLNLKPQKSAPIKSFMFLKRKLDLDGNMLKLKSRLVAGGHMQDRALIHPGDISSPTASVPLIFFVMAIAVQQRRKVVTIDIGGAYLNADISKHEILMELDPVIAGFITQLDPNYRTYVRPNGTVVVKLLKALYGCVQSGKLWYDLLSSEFIKAGFTPNSIDPCVLNKTIDGVQVTVCIYVDDILTTSASQPLIDEVINLL